MVALLGSIEHTDATDVYRLIIRDSNMARIFSVQDVSVYLMSIRVFLSFGMCST